MMPLLHYREFNLLLFKIFMSSSIDMLFCSFKGYCFKGKCPLHDTQCKDFWGKGTFYLIKNLCLKLFYVPTLSSLCVSSETNFFLPRMRKMVNLELCYGTQTFSLFVVAVNSFQPNIT